MLGEIIYIEAIRSRNNKIFNKDEFLADCKG